MRMKNLLGLVLILVVNVGKAQLDSSINVLPKQSFKNLTVSGYLDFYYRYDFSSPSSKVPDVYINYTDIKNNIVLGLANLAFKYENKKVEGFLEFGFGRKADDFSYEENTFTSRILKRAYFSYMPNERFKISIGKKYTIENYESVDVPDNNFYSYTYSFYITPNFNSGLFLNYKSKTDHSFELALTQPYNYLYGNSDDRYLSFQYISPDFAQKTNVSLIFFYYNKNAANFFYLAELILTQRFNSKLQMILDVSYSNTKNNGVQNLWQDLALFLNYQLRPKCSINWRSELFNSVNKGFFPVENTLVNTHTISAKFKLHKNIYLTPELKFDFANNKIYKKTETAFTGFDSNFFLSTYFVF